MFTSSSIYSWLQGGAPSYKSVIHSMIHHISIVNPNPDLDLPTWQSFWGTSLYDSLQPAGRILIWRAEVSWSWQMVSLVLLTMLLGCWVLLKRRPWIHPGLARNGLQPWKSSKERIMCHCVTQSHPTINLALGDGQYNRFLVILGWFVGFTTLDSLDQIYPSV